MKQHKLPPLKAISSEEDLQYMIRHKDSIIKKIGEEKYNDLVKKLEDHIAKKKIKQGIKDANNNNLVDHQTVKKLINKKLTKKIKEKIANGSLKFEMGSSQILEKYPHIHNYFKSKILHECLFSDDSYLTDFMVWMPGIRLQILDQFNVDIMSVQDKKLKDIYKYIDSKPKPKISADELAKQLGLSRK